MPSMANPSAGGKLYAVPGVRKAESKGASAMFEAQFRGFVDDRHLILMFQRLVLDMVGSRDVTHQTLTIRCGELQALNDPLSCCANEAVFVQEIRQ